MPSVGIRELKAKASEIVERVERGEAFLVTKRGRAVAFVLPLDPRTDDIILAEAPRFIAMRERARAEYARGRTISLKELRGSGKVGQTAKRRGVASRAR